MLRYGQWKKSMMLAALLLPILLVASFVTNASNGLAGTAEKSASPISSGLDHIYTDANLISPWAYDDIHQATNNGVIEGNGGKINPKGYITRAEFTKLMVMLLGIDLKEDDPLLFDDVRVEDWFYPYIHAGVKENIVSGYTDSEFQPYRYITRQEMAVIMVRALNIQPAASATLKDLNEAAVWAQASVKAVAAASVMQGDAGYFRPLDLATREMAFVVAMRAQAYSSSENSGENPVTKEQIRQLISQNATYMQRMVTSPTLGSIGGEWTIIGLARSGEQVPAAYYETYYRNVIAEVEKLMPATASKAEGRLDRSKGTEHSRLILGLTSIGQDITNVGGYDLRLALADFDYVTRQGINGPIFALIAFDSSNYEIPLDERVKVQTTRNGLIDFILDREIKGGGWALGATANEADPDITSMAIQALTPYYESRDDVKEAIDRGVDWLSSAQDSSGGFRSWGALNAESVSQVIVALSGLGIDANSDARFVKGNHSAIDALLSFSSTSGGFYHIQSGEAGNGGAAPGIVDPMATDQAMYALVAYERYLTGKHALYHMTDLRSGGNYPALLHEEAIQ